MQAVAIVNPIAGKGRALKVWPFLLKSLGDRAGQISTRWSEGPGHAEVLAGEARRAGCERVIAVGGDGTVFEAANGLWWEPHGSMPSLGIVPLGNGNDYARNFEIGVTSLDHLTIALGEHAVAVGAGLAHLQGLDGQRISRIFLNVLGLGFDANVVRRFQQRRSYLGGEQAYFLSGLQELASLKTFLLEGEVNGTFCQSDVLTFVVGLGRYFGGGMRITPDASPLSGRFQVVWGRHLSRLEILGLLAKIYAGRHLPHPKLRSCYTCHVKVTATPPTYIEADGEVIGQTPLEVKFQKQAFLIAAESVKRPG